MHKAVKSVLLCVFVVCIYAGLPALTGWAQEQQPKEPQALSLCSLQQKTGTGNHESVRVSGIYSEGRRLGR